MARTPERPGAPKTRDPARHSKKDPARPTRAKASRPDAAPFDPSLAELLNPAIGQGRAGVGSQTGMTSADSQWGTGGRTKAASSRRPTIRSTAALILPERTGRARRCTKGFGEPPQQGYVGKTPVPPGNSIRISRRPSASTGPTPMHPMSATSSRPTWGRRICGWRGRAAARFPRWPASPARSRWTGCCARAGRNSAASYGPRIARRDRKNPKAGAAS